MEVNERIIKWRKITRALIRNVTTDGAEVWDIGVRNRGRLLATEMDFLRRSSGLTRTDRVRNRRRMSMDGDLIDEIPPKKNN